MGIASKNLTNDEEFIERRTGSFDCFDLDAGKCKFVGKFSDREIRDVYVFIQPRNGNSHDTKGEKGL